MNAYELAMQTGELVEALQQHVEKLATEAAGIRQQLTTAKQFGLGEHLLAVDLLPNLNSRLVCIESLAQRAQAAIKSAEVD